MKRIRITAAVMALVLAAVFGTSAQAQSVTYTEGDLLIGFDQTGAANNYVVDLGQISQFINATGPLTFNLSTSDLTNTFGSSWASNSQTNLVQWGVIGAGDRTSNITSGSDTIQKNTLFYAVGELTPGTQSTPPTEGTNSAQNIINGNITANFANGSGGFNGTTPTAGSTLSLQAINQVSGAVNSWSYEISTKTDFGIGSNIQQPLSGSATGPTNSVLDLYTLTPTNASVTQPTTYLGDLSLGSSGVLTFTNAGAVPEPSSYALVGLGVLFLLWRLRQKAVSSL
jgi:hypothetical protein